MNGLVSLDEYRPPVKSAKEQLVELRVRLNIIASTYDKTAAKPDDEFASLLRETWRALDLLTAAACNAIGNQASADHRKRAKRLIAAIIGDDP